VNIEHHSHGVVWRALHLDAHGTFNMKNIALCFAFIALLAVAGCSHGDNATHLRSETGRGTFVSEKGEAVTAIYSKTGGTWDHATVRLLFPDKTEAELYVAISGSGARYTNGATEWWEHQGEATYAIGGTNVFHGKVMASR
jgi:membrane-bound inhibitor of C-type lysozyme